MTRLFLTPLFRSISTRFTLECRLFRLRSLASAALLAGGVSLLASCDRKLPDRMEITAKRVIFSDDETPPATVTSAMRFMDDIARLLIWNAPPDWKLMPSGNQRDLSFTFGPGGSGECYLTLLNSATTLEDNLARWRRQMQLEPYSEEEIERLPTLRFLGQDGVYVDLSGTYQSAMMAGAMAPPPKPDYRMLAVYVVLARETAVLPVSIKMVGPAELIAANKAAFESFCATINFNRAAVR